MLSGPAAEVALLISSDGNVYGRTGSGSSYGAGEPWLGDGLNSQFSIYLETGDGAVLDTGTANQWLTLDQDREFIVTRDTPGDDRLDGTLIFRRNTDNMPFDKAPVLLHAINDIA